MLPGRFQSQARNWYFSESAYSSVPGTARSLAQLEAAVDAVAGAERRREQQPRLERRPPAVLQVGVQDVGRVGEQVRPEVLAHLAWSSAR